MPLQTTYTINRSVRPEVGTERKDPLSNRQYTQTDEGYDRRRPNVGTAEETHTPSAELTDEGQTWIRNLSETEDNNLLVGPATGVYMHSIPPGEAELFWLKPGTVLYLKYELEAAFAEINIEGR